jgi:hypothetical protein
MEKPVILKRTKIVVGYLILFGIIYFVVYLVKTPDATCTDKIKNQGEKEIDCGGPCPPCKEAIFAKNMFVQEIAFAPGGSGTYDLVAKISNPNDTVGAKNFRYVFTLKNSFGEIIAKNEGTSFILPADTRYVVQLMTKTVNEEVPTSVDISISDVQWEILSGIGKPQIGVYDKNFGSLIAGVGSEAEGIVRNESTLDLKTVDVVIVLRDSGGKIVGINTTQKEFIRAKEQQKFKVTWPYQLGADVQKIEVDSQSNVFDY